MLLPVTCEGVGGKGAWVGVQESQDWQSSLEGKASMMIVLGVCGLCEGRNNARQCSRGKKRKRKRKQKRQNVRVVYAKCGMQAKCNKSKLRRRSTEWVEKSGLGRREKHQSAALLFGLTSPPFARPCFATHQIGIVRDCGRNFCVFPRV